MYCHSIVSNNPRRLTGAPSDELLGHFERDGPAERVADQSIGALGLHFADGVDVVVSHIFHARVIRLASVEAAR